MITNLQLPKVPAFASLPSFDLSSLQLPKFDLPKFDLPKVELPKVQLDQLEHVAGKAAMAARDGGYAVLGLGVVATQQLLKAAKQATEKAAATLQR